MLVASSIRTSFFLRVIILLTLISVYQLIFVLFDFFSKRKSLNALISAEVQSCLLIFLVCMSFFESIENIC